MLRTLEKGLELHGFDRLHNDALHLAPDFEYTLGAPVSKMTGAIILRGVGSDLKVDDCITVTAGSTLHDSSDVDIPRPAIAIARSGDIPLQVRFGEKSLFPDAWRVGELVVAKSQIRTDPNLWDVIVVDHQPGLDKEAQQATKTDFNETVMLIDFLRVVRGRSYSTNPTKVRPRHHSGKPPGNLKFVNRELLLTPTSD